MTVNRIDRDRLAAALRALATGKITNDEFENSAPLRSDDIAVRVLRDQAWFLYDDIREYRLRGADSLAPADRRLVARCLLFLGTDLEFSFPVPGTLTSFVGFFANLATLGFLYRWWAWRRGRQEAYRHWPFASKEDLERALPPISS